MVADTALGPVHPGEIPRALVVVLSVRRGGLPLVSRDTSPAPVGQQNPVSEAGGYSHVETGWGTPDGKYSVEEGTPYGGVMNATPDLSGGGGNAASPDSGARSIRAATLPLMTRDLARKEPHGYRFWADRKIDRG